MTRSKNSRKVVVAERPGPHGCPTCCRTLEKIQAFALQELPPFNVDAIKRAIVEYLDAREEFEDALSNVLDFENTDGHNCDVPQDRMVEAKAALAKIVGWKATRQAPAKEDEER